MPALIRPIRLRLSRKAGFDLQAHSIATNGLPAAHVGRPTLYGNPFIHPDPAQAVAAFRQYTRGGHTFEMGPGGLQFAPRIHKNSLHHAWREWLQTIGLPAIRGRNLACWCDLGAPCHADVLLELAAGPVCEAVDPPPAKDSEPCR